MKKQIQDEEDDESDELGVEENLEEELEESKETKDEMPRASQDTLAVNDTNLATSQTEVAERKSEQLAFNIEESKLYESQKVEGEK